MNGTNHRTFYRCTNRLQEKDYLVCIASDGCVFDYMELKHKEFFCPNTINVWSMQWFSGYVREAADFVNLYSDARGTNRFPAIVKTLELVYNRSKVKERGYVIPDLTPQKNGLKIFQFW